MSTPPRAGRKPSPAFARLEEAVTQLRSGRADLAQAAARKGLALAPRNIELWNIAAAAAMSLRDDAEAERCWQQAVAVAPPEQQALMLMNLGIFSAERGRLAQAEQHYQQALARDPQLAEAHFCLAALLARTGRDAEAEARYAQTLALNPQHFGAHYNRAALFTRLGRLAEAEQDYGRALEIQPANAAALCNLGSLLASQGRADEAEAAYRRALVADAQAPVPPLNLGRMLLDQGRLDEAEPLLKRATQLDAYSSEARLGYAAVLAARGAPLEAQLAPLAVVLARQPDHLPAQLARAGMLEQAGREAEARRSLLEAAARPATAAAPAPLRAELAGALLAQGCLAEGWPLLEARLEPGLGQRARPAPATSATRWRGEPLQGRSILLWPEQGHGDTIQFCRYAARLRALGAARVSLACLPPLLPLLASLAGDGVEVFALAALADQPPHDYWCPLLSLPGLLGETLQTLESRPARLPYLHADVQRREKWAQPLPAQGRRIGLVWRGSALHLNDAQRSLPDLASLAPLWDLPGVGQDLHFISLQKGAGEDEAACPPLATQPLLDLGSRCADFADLAAVIGQLDLLISVDTAAAHVAGALGVPCWLLLPARNTDWRWLRQRRDSPWYPQCMRLFRQQRAGEWQDAILQVSAALASIQSPGLATDSAAPDATPFLPFGRPDTAA